MFPVRKQRKSLQLSESLKKAQERILLLWSCSYPKLMTYYAKQTVFQLSSFCFMKYFFIKSTIRTNILPSKKEITLQAARILYCLSHSWWAFCIYITHHFNFKCFLKVILNGIFTVWYLYTWKSDFCLYLYIFLTIHVLILLRALNTSKGYVNRYFLKQTWEKQEPIICIGPEKSKHKPITFQCITL